MTWRFDGSPQEIEDLQRLVGEVADIQRMLLQNHPALHVADRAAHQMQIGAGRVTLEVATALPPELEGVGLFVPGTRAQGIGRVSTGLGCPHLETDPDFLGIMFAFQTSAGRRVDFLGINDPSAPTDTVEEFIALLVATAAAAGAEVPFGDAGQLDLGNLTASQAKLFNALRQRLGLRRAAALYLHIAKQTSRTARSSSAVQSYWTGVVEASGTPGKFSFVPAQPVNSHRALRPGARYLSEDWEQRLAAADIVFDVIWIPYRDEKTTPLEKNTDGWSEDHATRVGTVRFLRTEARSREARLIANFASEIGANPGHWVGVRPDEEHAGFPKTVFTAARQLAYAVSQAGRVALQPDECAEFFVTGVITPRLEEELVRRGEEKRRLGHASVLVVPSA